MSADFDLIRDYIAQAIDGFGFNTRIQEAERGFDTIQRATAYGIQTVVKHSLSCCNTPSLMSLPKWRIT